MVMQSPCLVNASALSGLLPSCRETRRVTGYQLTASNTAIRLSSRSGECPRKRPNDPKSGLCSCGRTFVQTADAGSVPESTLRDKCPKQWTFGQKKGHLFRLLRGIEPFSALFPDKLIPALDWR